MVSGIQCSHHQWNTFTLYLCSLQTWRDHRLTWNVGEFDGLDMIYIHVKNMWTPDISLYNKWVLHAANSRCNSRCLCLYYFEIKLLIIKGGRKAVAYVVASKCISLDYVVSLSVIDFGYRTSPFAEGKYSSSYLHGFVYSTSPLLWPCCSPGSLWRYTDFNDFII